MRNLVYKLVISPIEKLLYWAAFKVTGFGMWIKPTINGMDKEEFKKDTIDFIHRHEMRTRVGKIYQVTNSMKKPAADKEYYVVGLTNRVEDATDPIIFMFTDNELIRAEKRAQKNTEDIPADLSDPFYGTDNS